MILTFELDQNKVKMNQRAGSFSSEVIVRPHRRTHPTDCSTWTTKVVANEPYSWTNDDEWISDSAVTLVPCCGCCINDLSSVT